MSQQSIDAITVFGKEMSLDRRRTLDGEPALVTFFGRAIDGFKNELANRHSLDDLHIQRTCIPHFKLQRTSGIFGVLLLVSETGVDRRSCYVDANSKPSKTAFAFHSCGKPSTMRKLNFFDCPTKQKSPRLEDESVGAFNGSRVARTNGVKVVILAEGANHGFVPIAIRSFPAHQFFRKVKINSRRGPRLRLGTGRDSQSITGNRSLDFPVRENHANSSTSSTSLTCSDFTQRRLTPVSASWGNSTSTAFVLRST